jgi:hypothetical protein
MSYSHLTPRERYVISHLKSAKFPLREIARRLGRNHSTISREIRRNGPKYPGGVYWYYFIDPVVQRKIRDTPLFFQRKIGAVSLSLIAKRRDTPQFFRKKYGQCPGQCDLSSQ